MIEKPYFNLFELADKWSKDYDEPITVTDILKLGSSNKLVIQIAAQGLSRHFDHHPDLLITYDEIDLARPEETNAVAQSLPRRFEPLAENTLQAIEDLKLTDDSVITLTAVYLDSPNFSYHEKTQVTEEKM